MIDKKRAYRIIEEVLIKDRRHKHYDRVVKYAELLLMLMTGENAETLLVSHIRRESDDELKIRKKITQTITSSICGRLLKPQHKVPRVKPVQKTIQIDGDKAESRKARIDKHVKTYFGGIGLDGYLAGRYINYNNFDPNAFFLEYFKVENGKRVTFPIEIPCRDVLDFYYDNNILDYVCIRQPIEYETKEKDKDTGYFKVKSGFLYQIYFEKTILEFKQVDHTKYPNAKKGKYVKAKDADDPEREITIFVAKSNMVYEVKEVNHDCREIPLRRVGVIEDIATGGETCVSFIDAAIPYLRKSISAVSELDLSRVLHVFLQKVQYRTKCRGVSLKEPCNGGLQKDGKTPCTVCKGTGYEPHHTSAMDTIDVALPTERHLHEGKIFDLANLVKYIEIPVDILKWLESYVDKLSPEAIKAVFSNDLISQPRMQETATKVVVDEVSTYDALYPLGRGLGYMYEHKVRVGCGLMGFENQVSVVFQLPIDYKFKSEDRLLEQMKIATDSNASPVIKDELSYDLIQNLFVDRPQKLKQLMVKERFRPFKGKTENEAIVIMNSGVCTLNSKIMYCEEATIYRELEQEAISEKLNFYDLPSSEQKIRIDKKVEEIADRIRNERLENADINLDGNTGAGDTA